jgi:archaellum component FlaG (FlaF/FlaG flagellin family)
LSIFLLIAVLLATVCAAGTLGILSYRTTVATSGKISTINVSVYKDSACTQATTAIDWGTITPGASTTYTLYLKNTGNTKETLSLTTNSWSPTSAQQYLTITWDQDNAILNADQTVKATLTLNVASNIDNSITAFSNNIVLTGTM